MPRLGSNDFGRTRAAVHRQRVDGIDDRRPLSSDPGRERSERADRLRGAGVVARAGRGATVLVEPDHTELEEITALVEAGKLRPVVSDTFPLEDVVKAHELSESGRTTGKVVLTLT